VRGDAVPPAVSLRDVRFAWPGRRFALSAPAFDVAAGERVLLLGPSGGGKSTLLGLIAGINAPQAGSVAVLGEDLGAMRPAARDRFRAERMGVIFQMFNLLPYASAVDNVRAGLAFAPRRRARVRAAGAEAAQARAMLDALGLPEAALDGPAGALSVGQQQRVAVARALIGDPDLVIADEPTSALDAAAQDAFLALLFARAQAAGAALVMVSHDARLADRFDRAVALDDVARGERC